MIVLDAGMGWWEENCGHSWEKIFIGEGCHMLYDLNNHKELSICEKKKKNLQPQYLNKEK